MKRNIITHTEQQTQALGECIGKTLKAGDTVLLYGDLGTGKTALARGIARGLGITQTVNSPTFTIVNEYPFNDNKLIHMDHYRLSAQGVWELGLDEYWNEGNIVVVEWPKEQPPQGDILTIHMDYHPKGRKISICTQSSEQGRWEDIAYETAGN